MFATSATRAYFDVNVLLISYLTFYRMSQVRLSVGMQANTGAARYRTLRCARRNVGFQPRPETGEMIRKQPEGSQSHDMLWNET